MKQLYLDNVKSVSDKPIRENSSSLEVVSNELMCNNSQSSEVAEISTPERDISRLLGNLNEVVAGLKNSMDSFNVNQVNSSAVRPRPEFPRIMMKRAEARILKTTLLCTIGIVFHHGNPTMV